MLYWSNSMTSQNRVTQFLDSEHIHYSVVPHSHSKSSLSSAISAEVPMHRIAKAVMLEDHEGKHLMAIVPADYKVDLRLLSNELNRELKLAKEAQVYQMFADCDSGAIPPLPGAYHLDAVYDEQLTQEQELFLESGDHETLIQLNRNDFIRLMGASKHARFSHQVFH
ncbi:MAG: Ala-tRNA(Pro) deacylase [Paraglaciecola sp.]|jgi:Ala-tRNA(Pro) deacylase